MTISLSSLSGHLSSFNAAPLPAAKAVAKNEKAARDFESMLLTPVFDALQKTFADDSKDDKTTGASDYRQMGSQALAQAIAARGGIGIAKLILRHLEPHHLQPPDLQAPKVSGGS
jgi:Rod binding domain-containing protein